MYKIKKILTQNKYVHNFVNTFIYNYASGSVIIVFSKVYSQYLRMVSLMLRDFF